MRANEFIVERRANPDLNVKMPISQQIQQIIQKNGGTIDDYWIHCSPVEHVGFYGGGHTKVDSNDPAVLPRDSSPVGTPDRPMQAKVIPSKPFQGQVLNYDNVERGFRNRGKPRAADEKNGLWLSPLKPNFEYIDNGVLPFQNKFVFLVKLNDDAWVQPVNVLNKIKANLVGIKPPKGKHKIGQYNSSSQIAVIFEPAFKVVGQWTISEIQKQAQRNRFVPDELKQASIQKKARKAAQEKELDDLFEEPIDESTNLNEELRVDVPNEEWLQDAIDYAKSKSPDRNGLPYMGKTTASVRNVDVPLSILRRIPGMRQEQSKVRHHDLAAIRKIMSTTGKLPLHGHTGQEYKPFINVAYDGSAWVNEGNHRIMAAAELGWESLPVEISYFDGGERIKDGAMYPGRIGLGAPPLDEAEVGTTNAETIVTQLKAAGYSNVGTGADSTVWAKDENYIIKILMPEDLGTKAEQVFRKFYEFAMSHQDLACMPRFNEVNTIDINGKDYTQIEMERLAPIEKGTFMEGVIWFFSDFCQARESWDKVDHAMGLSDTWEWYPYAKSSKSIANVYVRQWQDLMYDKKSYSMYRELYNVMKLLYNTGTINKFGWDLHTANVMQRSNGQPVIIDPWFSEGTS